MSMRLKKCDYCAGIIMCSVRVSEKFVKKKVVRNKNWNKQRPHHKIPLRSSMHKSVSVWATEGDYTCNL